MNDVYINNMLIREGLNYFNGKKIGIFLLNASGSGGTSFAGIDGVLGASNDGTTAFGDITAQITNATNYSAVTFTALDSDDSNITFDETLTTDRIATFFMLTTLVDSNGDPTLSLADVNENNCQVLLIFNLSNILSLNNGSKFSFSQLEIRNGLI